MENREYLLRRLRGEAGGESFVLLYCRIDESGGIHFEHAREFSGDKGFHIGVLKPGGEYEVRMGETPEDEARVRFAEVEASPVIGTAEILEAFRRWKAGPGVIESAANAGTVREYQPAPDAEEQAAIGQ